MTATALHTQVRHFGHGPRKALAIHCTLAHAGAWSGVAEALSDDLTITAYDLPSHGRSSDWTPDRDQHRMATDMGLALLNEPMDLIGHSYGATVAMRMAIEAPERVRSLTMIEPVYFVVAEADVPGCSERNKETIMAMSALIEAGDKDAAARVFSEQWGNGAAWDDIPERARRYMADRIHFVPGGGSFLHADPDGVISQRKLEKLPMPVLVMQGQLAPEIIDTTNAAIARRVPNARRATIAGAGHMAPISHPQAVADELRKLLEMS